MRPAPEGDDPRSVLREVIEAGLRAGLRPVDDLLDEACEAAADVAADPDDPEVPDPADRGDPDELRVEAHRIADEVTAVLRAEASVWPARTDCDRLDAAFEELDAAGVTARQDFSCCARCAPGEMAEEMDAAEEAGRPPRGYVYFHAQDTEAAVRGEALWLGYGPRDPHDADRAKWRAVADEVVAALRRHGLRPEWEGDTDRRIRLPIDWKRRGAWWVPPVPAPEPAPATRRTPAGDRRPAEDVPPPIPAEALRRRLADPLPTEPPTVPFRFSVDQAGALFVGHAPWIGLWMLVARTPIGGLVVACFLSLVFVGLARQWLLSPLRGASIALRTLDLESADRCLTLALARFGPRPVLDRVRGAVLFDLGDVGVFERASAWHAFVRAHLGDPVGAEASLRLGFRRAPASRLLRATADAIGLGDVSPAR